jgi:hypothetical protein
MHRAGDACSLAKSKLPSLQLDLHREAAGIADALDRRRHAARSVPPSSQMSSAR